MPSPAATRARGSALSWWNHGGVASAVVEQGAGGREPAPVQRRREPRSRWRWCCAASAAVKPCWSRPGQAAIVVPTGMERAGQVDDLPVGRVGAGRADGQVALPDRRPESGRPGAVWRPATRSRRPAGLEAPAVVDGQGDRCLLRLPGGRAGGRRRSPAGRGRPAVRVRRSGRGTPGSSSAGAAAAGTAAARRPATAPGSAPRRRRRGRSRWPARPGRRRSARAPRPTPGSGRAGRPRWSR